LGGIGIYREIHVSDPAQNKGSACASGCGKCSALDQSGRHPDGLTGWALVGAALCVFLFPLATATAGAILAGRQEMHQFAGAFGGLAAGLVVGVIMARLIGRPAKEKV
jgi:hypothetical protein